MWEFSHAAAEAWLDQVWAEIEAAGSDQRGDYVEALVAYQQDLARLLASGLAEDSYNFCVQPEDMSPPVVPPCVRHIG